jgi:hypothetical protein
MCFDMQAVELIESAVAQEKATPYGSLRRIDSPPFRYARTRCPPRRIRNHKRRRETGTHAECCRCNLCPRSGARMACTLSTPFCGITALRAAPHPRNVDRPGQLRDDPSSSMASAIVYAASSRWSPLSSDGGGSGLRHGCRRSGAAAAGYVRMRTVVVRSIGSSEHRLYSWGHVAARMIAILISDLYECRNNVEMLERAAVLAISGLLVIAPLALHELGAFLRSRQCCCAAIGSWCLACTASSYPPRG